MSRTLNEYIHLHEIRKIDNLYRAIYEPFENGPATNLCGCIYFGDIPTQAFKIVEQRVIETERSINYKCMAFHGLFVSSLNSIVLYWNINPDNHFLCASYDFVDWKPMEVPKPNWLQEGF